MKRNLTIVVIMLAACWVTAPQLGAQAPADLDARVAADLDALLATYRHLHANPELSYQEKETAALVARELRALGFEVTENFGAYPAVQGAAARAAYGVVAVMRNGAGPTIMVRTDLDALPVEERTGVPYASRAKAMQEGTEVSVMHACGHDVHMTSFLGTARLLTKMKDRWAGTLIMIGQPAEERGAGAAAMLRAGLYTKFPRPQTVVALHVMADVPAGQVGMVEGFTLASSDSVDVTIYGVGGHGAAPHATKDPVVIAAQFINAIQTIVSRELNPLDPAVVTVGSIHAGTKHNIISDEARLQLTVRAYKPEVRERILNSLERIARGVAAAAGVPNDRMPVVRWSREESTPSTYNDPPMTRRLGAAIRGAIGAENVIDGSPIMPAEDFSRFGLEEPRVPIVMFWLGASDPKILREAKEKGMPAPGLHSALFTPVPDVAIRTGVKAMTAAVLDLMKK